MAGSVPLRKCGELPQIPGYLAASQQLYGSVELEGDQSENHTHGEGYAKLISSCNNGVVNVHNLYAEDLS